ncbi:MAG TPA: hypothetical protein DEB31_08080 [Clostridiales bacterium]|nr:hypothetical protein [Clostridiales bacterium]
MEHPVKTPLHLLIKYAKMYANIPFYSKKTLVNQAALQYNMYAVKSRKICRKNKEVFFTWM